MGKSLPKKEELFDEIDYQMLDSFMRGEKAGFDHFFYKLREGFLRYIARLTKGSADGEDILQDSFLVLWTRKTKISTPGDPKKYLKGIVYKKCMKHLRKLSKRRSDKSNIEIADDPAQRYELNDENKLLYKKALKSIQKLSPLQRQIIQDTVIGDKGDDKVAEQNNIQKNRVRSERSKALAKIRSLLTGGL